MTLAPLRRPERLTRLHTGGGFGDQTLRRSVPGAIDLTGGIPAPEALPSAALSASLARVLARPGVPALQYSHAAGVPGLRQWIAAREGVDPERVVVTNGGFHGLMLAVQLTVERGALVAVDDPVFPLFVRGLETVAARSIPIRVDQDGINVEELATRLRAGERPAAVYTVPDFQNPSQVVLSAERRTELVRLAEHYGFAVLVDNPYRELRFTGDPVSTLPFTESDHVISVGTFTKTLGPGLRLGWVILPARLVPDATALRSRSDGHSSVLVQHAVADLLTADPLLFDRTLEAATASYRARADELIAGLHATAADALEVVRPEGGLFLWPRLRNGRIDADRLADDARALGVDYQRGAYFDARYAAGGGASPARPGGPERHLRMSFGHVSEHELAEAASRLGEAIIRQLGRS